MASNEIILSDSENEEDSCSGSSDENEDYQPTDAETEEESEESEDELVCATQGEREQAILQPNTWILSKDQKIQYSSDDCPPDTQRNAIPTIHKGPTTYATSRITNPVSAFLLFLKPIETIVLDMTNLYGLRKFKETWENIDLVTLRAYFGLLLLAGVYRSKGECMTDLWDDKRGRPIFRATMSLKYFKYLNSCIRFDDKENRLDRRARDKLAAIRNVFDKWNKNLRTMYVVGDCVSVGEQLIPFRGKSPFRQYIPSKPYKYGIKTWVLCDSRTFYAYNMQIYTGRDRNCAPETNQGKRVVLELTDGLHGRNVTCDNFFTSYELAKELKQRKMTIVGTIRKNRKEIPPILLDIKRKAQYHSEFVFDHNLRLTMVSYIPRKNRCVTLLSTLHTKKSLHNTQEKKPDIIHYYNQTKSVVDVLDERIGTYRCKRKVNRWPMAIFANMLDVSVFNAFVIFTELNPEWKEREKKYRRRLFIIDVADDLVMPYIEVRKRTPRSEHANAVVRMIRGIPSDPSSSRASGVLEKLPPVNKRARCHICTSKNNLNLYSNRCDMCQKYVCAQHFFKICDKCT